MCVRSHVVMFMFWLFFFMSLVEYLSLIFDFALKQMLEDTH